jgi:4-amino-4-deoxy-L-arabinose transferase-like glycosyltransferase
MLCRGQPNGTGINKLSFRYNTGAILLGIILLGAALRLVSLGKTPPGLNQDEAANAWNAYCLLKTGKDQAGVSWPILYTRGLGGNRTTLYIYAMLPFQAVGGLNVVTARLPAAVGGILTILLIYFVAKRLFGEKVGLIAAALLALNPWHLQQSRWGHEASIGPLLGILPLAMLLWANMPVIDSKNHRPRIIPAALAGVITGICCYGYHALRLFIPIFLFTVCLVTLPVWWKQLKTRKGILAVLACLLGFALIFTPLVWEHIFHPEGIARHTEFQVSLIHSDSLPLALKNMALRYVQHFGLDFLFIRGDHYQIQSPPGAGQFHWYMLPLMIAGLIAVVRQFRSSHAVRILLVYVLTYPIGDCFFKGIGMHSLRSSPGLCSLVILAALGAFYSLGYLWEKSRSLALIMVVIFTIAVPGLNARYFYCFYGKYKQQPDVYHGYYSDLVEACRWLRPRLDEDGIEAVFCSTSGMGMAYIVTLVSLEHEPDRWFGGPRRFTTIDEFDFCTNYGKMYFMYSTPASILQLLQELGFSGRVIFIVRPGELGLEDPVHRIVRPDGKETLWICQY